jgi:glycerophosphoryl diester phosphodiesterase
VQLVAASGSPCGDDRSYADLLTPAGLADVATYASAVGVDHALLWPAGEATVSAAHAAGLAVHAWTVRDENRYLPEPFRRGTDPGARGDAVGLTEALLDLGVDGVFTDQADTAVEARRRWLDRTARPAGPDPSSRRHPRGRSRA